MISVELQSLRLGENTLSPDPFELTGFSMSKIRNLETCARMSAISFLVFRSSEGRETRSRQAFTIVELIGTCLLFGILFSITVPMLLVVAKERRSTEQRQFAMQHAVNLLEHASTRPWPELVPGELTVPAADPDLQTVLPGLERTLTANLVEGEPESRRLVATIRWQGPTGQLVKPLELSAWVYPTKEVP